MGIKIIGDFIGDMKARLRPEGTAPLVGLHLKNASYFDEMFVKSCIEQIEKINALQVPLSPLETLAIQVLMDSAYLELSDYVKEDTYENHN